MHLKGQEGLPTSVPKNREPLRPVTTGGCLLGMGYQSVRDAFHCPSQTRPWLVPDLIDCRQVRGPKVHFYSKIQSPGSSLCKSPLSGTLGEALCPNIPSVQVTELSRRDDYPLRRRDGARPTNWDSTAIRRTRRQRREPVPPTPPVECQQSSYGSNSDRPHLWSYPSECLRWSSPWTPSDPSTPTRTPTVLRGGTWEEDR